MKGEDLRYQKELHKTRLQMLALYEVNRDRKKSPEALKPSDIIHLPLLDEVVDKKESIEQVEQAKHLIKERWR